MAFKCPVILQNFICHEVSAAGLPKDLGVDN